MSRRRMPTQDELARAMVLALEMIRSGKVGPAPDAGPTVRELWGAYEPYARDRHPSWFSTERARFAHVLEHLGDRRASSLTLTDVDRYRDARRGEATPFGTKTSPATRNREVGSLRHLLRWSARRRLISGNPLDGIEMEAEHNVRQTNFSEADVERLIDHARRPLRLLILLAFLTGMRRDELRLLRWDQVDLERRFVRLAPADTKTGTGRVIPLQTRAVDALRAWPHVDGNPHVFASHDPRAPGRPVDYTTLHDLWKRAVAAAGIVGARGEYPRLHDLRRSFVTLARRRGVDETVIMRIVGHKTRSMFLRYSIVSEEETERAMARLEKGAATELAEAKRQQRRETTARELNEGGETS